MFFLICFIVISTIGIGCSYPIALQYGIDFSTIIYDYLACLTYCGVVSGALMLIFRMIFKWKFNPNSKLFYVHPHEVAFYEFTKIRKWKKLIPDMGSLVGFKKKMDSMKIRDSQFYYRFLYENVNASYLHAFTFLFSPVFFSFLTRAFYATIGTSCMLIVFIFNVLPAVLQRSLRPRLLNLYNRALAKENAAIQKPAFQNI